jgi:thioredoxin-related protein
MAKSVTLPAAVSLPDELALALAAGLPLVVMVSLEGCPFCKIVRESFLAPMQQEQGLPVVQVDMRSRRSVKDFNGSTTTHEALVARWRIELAPTVLFWGRTGIEVAQRLVGGYIPDFYGAYLEQRLELARRAVAKPA